MVRYRAKRRKQPRRKLGTTTKPRMKTTLGKARKGTDKEGVDNLEVSNILNIKSPGVNLTTPPTRLETVHTITVVTAETFNIKR